MLTNQWFSTPTKLRLTAFELCLQLFTHREDVDILNKSELHKLAGEMRTFTAQDVGQGIEALKTACPVSQKFGHSKACPRNEYCTAALQADLLPEQLMGSKCLYQGFQALHSCLCVVGHQLLCLCIDNGQQRHLLDWKAKSLTSQKASKNAWPAGQNCLRIEGGSASYARA